MAVSDAQPGNTTLDEEITILWTLICAIFVVFMQCGFALLESGTVRQKNIKNILLKNIITTAISTACWWSLGHAFAYGTCGQNPFVGASNFFSADAEQDSDTYWAGWFFSWAFSATAASIVSGAVAERTQLKAYVIYTTFISAWIYPVVVYWVWSSNGWLAARRQTCVEIGSWTYSPLLSKANGLMDFAGSGVVHMVGGGAALAGACLLGPRLGRYNDDGSVNRFEHSNPTSMVVGVFILWLGWYGFNSGSTGCFAGCMGTAAKVAVNTTLSASFSAMTALALAVILGDAGDIGPLLNGVLAGAVSITAGCAYVQSYAAVAIGVVAGFVYTAGSRLLIRLRIDDPVDAVSVHFFGGAWGLLAVGFFATETSTQTVYHYANDWGVFYGGRGYQLGVQLLGIVCIAAWSCGLSFSLFFLLKRLNWLRVPREVEVKGLDFAQGFGKHQGYRACEDIFSGTVPPGEDTLHGPKTNGLGDLPRTSVASLPRTSMVPMPENGAGSAGAAVLRRISLDTSRVSMQPGVGRPIMPSGPSGHSTHSGYSAHSASQLARVSALAGVAPPLGRPLAAGGGVQGLPPAGPVPGTRPKSPPTPTDPRPNTSWDI